MAKETDMRKTLITGGARSGKSAWALSIVPPDAERKIFIATAEARDGDMKARIENHKKERGPGWVTVEEPVDLVPVVARYGGRGDFVLIDCLTLWTSNLMELDDASFSRRAGELAGAIGAAGSAVAVVTNEAGMGIVPADPATRKYRDRLGAVNAMVARVCGRLVLMVAGQPMIVKGAL